MLAASNLKSEHNWMQPNLNYIGFRTAMASGEPTAPLGLGKKGTTRAWIVEVQQHIY